MYASTEDGKGIAAGAVQVVGAAGRGVNVLRQERVELRGNLDRDDFDFRSVLVNDLAGFVLYPLGKVKRNFHFFAS